MENAVIYARYSSQGQNEQSIEGQIRIDTEFAASRGLNIVGKYIDKARTGTNDNRPDFQRMLRDAESGAFQYIIVYKFDRFARNRLDNILHKAQLKKQYGIKVVSATEPVSDDEGGEIYEMFLEWNDEKYSQRLSKRVHEGLDTMVISWLTPTKKATKARYIELLLTRNKPRLCGLSLTSTPKARTKKTL